MSVLISLISALGSAVAATATNGCIAIFIDEPKMPESMLER